MGHPENTNSLHVLVFTWVACNTSFILRCTSFQLLVKREEHIKGARMLIRVANNISKFPSRKCMNIYNYFWASCAVKHKCIVFLAWVGGGGGGRGNLVGVGCSYTVRVHVCGLQVSFSKDILDLGWHHCVCNCRLTQIWMMWRIISTTPELYIYSTCTLSSTDSVPLSDNFPYMYIVVNKLCVEYLHTVTSEMMCAIGVLARVHVSLRILYAVVHCVHVLVCMPHAMYMYIAWDIACVKQCSKYSVCCESLTPTCTCTCTSSCIRYMYMCY